MLGENLTDAQICPQNLGSNERRLRNGDLKMTYWIMSAGFCTGAVVFITEVNNYSYKMFTDAIYLTGHISKY